MAHPLVQQTAGSSLRARRCASGIADQQFEVIVGYIEERQLRGVQEGLADPAMLPAQGHQQADPHTGMQRDLRQIRIIAGRNPRRYGRCRGLSILRDLGLGRRLLGLQTGLSFPIRLAGGEKQADRHEAEGGFQSRPVNPDLSGVWP